jgi:flagellar biosynthesis/type III secretory pathway protein FliH
MVDVTLYYRTADGALVSRTVSGDQVEGPELPEDATVLTEEEYTAARAEVEAARQAHAAQLAAEAEAAQREDYEALRALGVPEVSARRMSGYTGPDLEPAGAE